jgi:hypothetical protein
MTEIHEMFTDAEDQLLETLTDVQESIVDAVEKIVDRVQDQVPDVGAELPDGVPSAVDVVDSQFTFAGRVLQSQQQFVNALFDAVRPLTVKVVAEAPKVKPAKAKATAKAA